MVETIYALWIGFGIFAGLIVGFCIGFAVGGHVAFSLKSTGRHMSRRMSVDEARSKNVCRICGKTADGPLTMNYGAEYAHTKCLGSTTAAPRGTPPRF